MRELDSKVEKLHHTYRLFIENNQIEESLVKRLKEIGLKAKIPGFRQGHIPVEILMKNYGESARQEVIISEIKKTIAEFLKSKDLKPAFQPSANIKNTDDTGMEVEIGFDVLPEISVVDVGHPKVKKYRVKVDEAKVDELLNDIIKNHKAWDEKPEGAVSEKGDKVVADIKLVGAKKKSKNKDLKNVEVILDDSDFVENFWSNLVGVKVGEEKEFSVSYDGEKSPTTYHVHVNKIYARKDSELNDELAKSLGLQSKDQVRDWVRDVLRSEFRQDVDDLIKKQVLDAMADGYNFDVPESMVEIENKEIVRQLEIEAKKNGQRIIEDQRSALMDDGKEIAVRRVRLGLVIAKIASDNGIKVSSDELRNAVFSIARMYPGHEAEVAKRYFADSGLLSAIAGPLLEDKVVQLIIEKNAEVEEVEVTPDELKKIDDEAFGDFGEKYLESDGTSEEAKAE